MATREMRKSDPKPGPAHLPQTLGELRASREWNETRLRTRSVKDEMRANLIARIKARETIFPGIVGYEDTVVPQIVNAVLSKQNFILLGLRGQAKSRILRALTRCSTSIRRTWRDARFATTPMRRCAGAAAT